MRVNWLADNGIAVIQVIGLPCASVAVTVRASPATLKARWSSQIVSAHTFSELVGAAVQLISTSVKLTVGGMMRVGAAAISRLAVRTTRTLTNLDGIVYLLSSVKRGYPIG